MSLENPHDGLTGIGIVVTVEFALWKEPQTAGVAFMPGRSQQFGYCWGPVGPGQPTWWWVVEGVDIGLVKLLGREVF